MILRVRPRVKLWLLTGLVNHVSMSLVVSQFNRDVISYEDS